jgi:phosphoglycolate phosphatase-like HAD superfamily hydrolase
MAKAFGFDDSELKMLLVAVRQMRRTFAAARKTAPAPQPAVDAYAKLYDDLYKKLLDMAGPLPDAAEDVLKE